MEKLKQEKPNYERQSQTLDITYSQLLKGKESWIDPGWLTLMTPNYISFYIEH